MPLNERDRAIQLLEAVGRGFEMSTRALRDTLIQRALGVRLRRVSDARYIGGPWISHENGFTFNVPLKGAFHVPADAYLEKGEVRIELCVTLKADSGALAEAQKSGYRARVGEQSGPDRLRNTEGLVSTRPKPLETLVIDLKSMVLRTSDPAGPVLELHEVDSATQLCCDQDEMLKFLTELIFTALGIVALRPLFESTSHIPSLGGLREHQKAQRDWRR